jgi:hypothetical protein
MATIKYFGQTVYKACHSCEIPTNKYYTIRYQHNIHYVVCKNCYTTEIFRFCANDPYSTEINKDFLLLPLGRSRGCNICHVAEIFSGETYAHSRICSRLIFTLHPDMNFEACRNCLCNNLADVMHRILAKFRTREMMETIYEQHPSPQKYFSYLNKREKYMIACDRDTLKKIIGLPTDLYVIVLGYYWIFEK